MGYLRALLALTLIVLLAACAGSGLLLMPEPLGLSAAQVEAISATEIAAPDGVATAEALEPLNLIFPTAAPFPVPGWRPPQYSVPLSYRPEDHFWFVRPIPANTINWPLPEYRYGGTYFGEMAIHTGVDIDAPVGTSVLAAGAGKVVWAGWGLYGTRPVEDDPYGLAVAIRHDFGFEKQPLYTVYAHMETVSVWPDQVVQAGEAIGTVGLTGNTTGAHLHFEVREAINGFYATRNPELWIAPPQGWGVLAGRAVDDKGQLLSELGITITSLSNHRQWTLWTYGKRIVNGDRHYAENFAISDLPAGEYEVSLTVDRETYSIAVPVHAGQTNFLEFRAGRGFAYEPKLDEADLPVLALSGY